MNDGRNSSSDEKALGAGEIYLAEAAADAMLASRQSAVEDLHIPPLAWGRGVAERLTADGWSVVRTSELARTNQAIEDIRADLYGLLGAIDGHRDYCAGSGNRIGERELLELRRDLARILSGLSEHQDGTDG